MKKKLTCHCGGVEAEVKIPETGIEKLMRCNCTPVSYTHLTLPTNREV